MQSIVILRVILGLTGLAVMILGLNIGLGGMQTLGWQISTGFVAVLDEGLYEIQDNHFRFLGGVWFSIGGVYLLSSVWFGKLQQTIVIISLAVAFGGMFRLSVLDLGILLKDGILASFILEIAFFPVLAFWAKKTKAE
ncbi:DUF4345 domain-containing protein [Sneathiella sp. P13V-1]|uniref:DUF4345 family protein n=1 Tax=Sneathiella sp. P13V-1 TaxID=2697366 RepID=UPI00187B22FE|nr:DUF4345 family protein [Sneathiella sp. P13V-1]MBE7635295.1 DUF4345 domain-containing protein [Sneathiella sp. P13V-1]